jgi:hypothetical protein
VSELNLFQTEKPLPYRLTWACNVYSMVPYLGILFIPFALALGGFDYVSSRRKQQGSESRLAITSLVLSFFLLVAQLFLWSLLYIIPQLRI